MNDAIELTPQRMWELLATHGRLEYESDIEGVMSTIGADPLWEFHPLGLRVQDRDAIRLLYECQFEHILPRLGSAVHRTVSYGERCMVRESSFAIRMPDGSAGSGIAVAILEFEDSGLIRSERGYASGDMNTLVDLFFPESMWDLPGASRIF
jgi:hypothetical protein